MPQPDIGLCWNCEHGWIPKGKSKRCPRCRSRKTIFVKPKDIIAYLKGGQVEGSQEWSGYAQKVSDFM